MIVMVVERWNDNENGSRGGGVVMMMATQGVVMEIVQEEGKKGWGEGSGVAMV